MISYSISSRGSLWREVLRTTILHFWFYITELMSNLLLQLLLLLQLQLKITTTTTFCHWIHFLCASQRQNEKYIASSQFTSNLSAFTPVCTQLCFARSPAQSLARGGRVLCRWTASPAPASLLYLANSQTVTSLVVSFLHFYTYSWVLLEKMTQSCLSTFSSGTRSGEAE